MVKLERTGVGVDDHVGSIRDIQGSGLLPVQALGDGVTTFRVLGKVSPEAPWVELKAEGSADFLEAVSWVPYLRLEVMSGGGTVILWVAE